MQNGMRSQAGWQVVVLPVMHSAATALGSLAATAAALVAAVAGNSRLCDGFQACPWHKIPD